jgi:PAS domain S-box-containing protein
MVFTPASGLPSDTNSDPDIVSRDLFNACPHGWAILDESEQIIDCNEAFAHLMGRASTQELVAVPFSEVCFKNEGFQILAARQIFHRMGGFRGSLLLKTSNSISVAADCTWYPLPTAPNQPSRSAVLILDHSKERAREVELLHEMERLNLAITAANDGIWDWDLQTNLCRFSPRFLDIVGMTASETSVDIEHWFSRIHPDDRSRVDEELQMNLDGRSPTWRSEHRILGGGQNWVWVLICGKVVRDFQGKAYRMAGSLTDTTAVHQAMEEQARYRQLVESCHQMMGIIDHKGMLIRSNAYAQELLGLSQTPVHFYSIFPESEQAKITTAVHRAFAGEKISGESFFTRHDGGKIDVRFSFFAVGPPCTSNTCTVGIVLEDVSEINRTQRLIQARKEELAHAMRMSITGELAAGLAHELNQPLGAVVNYSKGSLQALDAVPFDRDALKHAINQTVQQAQLAGQIIRQIRDFVRKGTGTRVPCDLNALVVETVKFIEFALRKDDVAVELELEQGLPTVMVDSIQIQQVLLNLFRNAMDSFRKSEQVERRIVVTTTRTEESLKVCVLDNGPGIHPDVRPNIFEPFHHSTSEGLGLGLTICRNLVESHGGRLWFEDGPEGSGTCFCFQIPFPKIN